MAIKRNLLITTENPHRTATVSLSYVGTIDWFDRQSRDSEAHLQKWLRKTLAEIGDKTIHTRKFRVFMDDGVFATRTITAVFSVASNVKDAPASIQPAPRLAVAMDKPIGKSYLASHIHGYLKATAKNMATDTEIAKINSELHTLTAKVKQLEAKRTELEANRKIATNDHNAVAHFGKLLEIAFRGEFVFNGVRDEGYCKVLSFVCNGETKVLPVSVFMVTEQVTKAHNVASNATLPMPMIHVLNESNVMIPVTDLTPAEIMQFLR